jgi:PPM family protein phosphatase
MNPTMSAATLPVSIHSERGRRSVNQDSAVVYRLSDGRDLVAVADGMGGHAAGEVASRRALEVLCESLEHGLPLGRAVIAANVAIHKEAAENPDLLGMGTTLVALLRDGESYSLANVGDSRAYRVRQVTVEQITEDHNFSAESVREGRLSAEEAARSPWRRALTRAIGTDEEVEVDLFGPLPTDPPHAVLLCTDGVHGVVPDEALLEVINASPHPDDAARLLARAAYEAGSDDNITVALVAFGYPGNGAYGDGASAPATSGSGSVVAGPVADAAGSEPDSGGGVETDSPLPAGSDRASRHIAGGLNGALVLLSGLLLVRSGYKAARRIRRWLTHRNFVDLDT